MNILPSNSKGAMPKKSKAKHRALKPSRLEAPRENAKRFGNHADVDISKHLPPRPDFNQAKKKSQDINDNRTSEVSETHLRNFNYSN